jgi:Carbohydrate family 9 binding domain-like
MGTRPHSTRAAIVTMVLLTSAHTLARAQNVRAGRTGPLNATRVDQSVRVDGKLDEPFWRLVRPAGRFTQVEPVEGSAPTKPTDVRLVFTDDAVVIGARLEDDAHVLEDATASSVSNGRIPDYFEVQIDPHPAHGTVFDFVVTVRGETRATLVTAQGATIDSWAITWEAATSVDADGWTIEMRIPLSEMHIEKGNESWGVGLKRFSWKRMETDVLDGRKPRRVASSRRDSSP